MALEHRAADVFLVAHHLAYSTADRLRSKMSKFYARAEVGLNKD
jgi:hypothetical protein